MLEDDNCLEKIKSSRVRAICETDKELVTVVMFSIAI